MIFSDEELEQVNTKIVKELTKLNKREEKELWFRVDVLNVRFTVGREILEDE